MNKNLNLQDVILNQIRKDKIASTFYPYERLPVQRQL